MPSQVVYQTNADLIGSHEALVNNSLVKVKADMTEKGLLWFQFKDSQTVFLLSAMGKLQVKWNDVHEKRMLYKFVKNLLVAKPNEKLLIRPLKQQIWIEYPVPPSFKLYWCDNATEFVLKTSPERSEVDEGNRAKAVKDVFPRKRVPKARTKVEDEEESIRVSLEALRNELRYFREPSLKSVAFRSGCYNGRRLKKCLDLAGWIPRPEENARWEAEQAINLAGWLRFKEKGEGNAKLRRLCRQAFDRSSAEVIARAECILKNLPSLVPEVNEDEIKWPDEAKMRWVNVFGCDPPSPKNLRDEPTMLIDRLIDDPNYSDVFHNKGSFF